LSVNNLMNIIGIQIFTSERIKYNSISKNLSSLSKKNGTTYSQSIQLYKQTPEQIRLDFKNVYSRKSERLMS